MPSYRLYTLDPDTERIAKPPHMIEADNDEAAVAEAMRLLDGWPIEVWRMNVMVARLSHEPKTDAAATDGPAE